ncbi:pilus assembly protein PilQ [Persephonella sp.]
MRIKPVVSIVLFLVLTTVAIGQPRITAEFYGAKLSTVVDVISELSNKNIIWDRASSEKSSTLVYLTIRKPVSVETLFRLVLDEYGLTYIKTGGVYTIKVADKALITIPPDVIKYLGKDVFDSFVVVIKDNLSNNGKLKILKASNSVYIEDYKENVDNIRKIVEEFLKPLVKEAEKLAEIEKEREKKLKEAALEKEKIESMLVKKEIRLKPEEFKAIEDKLIESLSPYGKYSYDKKKGILTVIEVRNNFARISKILAKAQKVEITTKCYYVKALEPAELLISIKENFLSKYGSVIFKSKETAKAMAVRKEGGYGGSNTGGTTTVTTGTGGYSQEEEKEIITSLPKICITDLPEVVNKIYKNYSDVLLKRPYQIAIEARIVQIESSFQQDLGIQWGVTNSGVILGDVGYGVSTGSLTGYMFDFPAGNVTTGKGASLAIGIVRGLTTSLDMQLSALEQIGKTKILSRPKVITIDGEGAEISQGIEIPYQATTVAAGGLAANIRYKKALLKLNVIPRTTLDGNIIMNIELTQDVPDFGRAVNGQPPINTKSITSKVVAKDGSTIVIGGILEKTEQEGESGVPGLRNIPIIGWLFKNKTVNHSNKELLIFITPKIIYE